MKRMLAIGATLGVAALVSCEKKAAPPAPPVEVTVAPVVQKDVEATSTWVGLLDGYQNASIRAQVTGYLLTQNYKEGSFVKKGTVLFTIDQRPFQAALAQAQADYAKAVAQAQLTQVTLQRQTELYKTKVISQQQYDTFYQDNQSALATAAAQQAAVQTAQINLDYCTVTAPFDGIVGVAQAQIGDLVGPSSPEAVLTQMSQVNPIKVNFSITEQQYLQAAPLIDKLQNATSEELKSRISLRLADGTEYPHKGKFDFVNRQVNVGTGSIQITALFPNDENLLRPGLFARVTAPTEAMPNALLVPQAAVVELQGNHLISTVNADNVVSTGPVELGPTQGQMQVITKGLQPGDRVVVGGVEKVKPGMKVNVQPAQPPPAASPTESKPASSPEATPAN